MRIAKGTAMRPHRSILSAAVAMLFAATAAAGAPLCKPDLAVKDVTFTPMLEGQRIWAARIAVDASHCATAWGRFDVVFVRLKENAPDLPFRERFTWRTGEVEASSVVAADEAVLDYAIEAASCPCR
jgi:hypothetical protein